MQPYWGKPTASVDWCEKNYVVSNYIAEWYNTISSMGLLISGAIGLYLANKHNLETRIKLAYASIIVTGIGSMCFHATLLYSLQMMDELPMLWGAMIILYIVYENQKDPQYPWLPLLLLAFGTFSTIVVASTSGIVQFVLFDVGFFAIEMLCLYNVGLLYREMKTRSRILQQSDTLLLLRMFKMVFGLFALACTSWILDRVLCPVMDRYSLVNPQLHSVWHILMSITLYIYIMILSFTREEVLQSKPTIRWIANGLPYVLPLYKER